LKTNLITGVGGMVGSHMAEWFYSQGEETIGTYYKPTTAVAEIQDKCTLIECDVRYYLNVYKVINTYRPNRIFHLAAQSYPSISWDRPHETMDINVNGTINVFEAIRKIRESDPSYDPIVVVACSSAEYGDSLNTCIGPADEKLELLPLHPYGVSKVAQDLLSYQYYVNYGIKTIRARIFNTTGPRKENDVSADFTKRIVLMEKKKSSDKHLRVGNLKTKRAITDVRDLVSALVLLADKGKHGDVYNISGKKVYQMNEIVEIIRKNTKIKFETQIDDRLLRPSDEKIIYGDSEKLIKDTGWEQKLTLEETIKDMLDYWRNTL